MTEDASNFIQSFGSMLWNALNAFKIPGTNISFISLILGILLLMFLAKFLRFIFGYDKEGKK